MVSTLIPKNSIKLVTSLQKWVVRLEGYDRLYLDKKNK